MTTIEIDVQVVERNRILKQFKEWEHGDREVLHEQADKLIAQYLRLLGENEVADAFDKMYKWYA